jgi:hypothetical protein|tara:strand:- start:390 stop:713 length:324 start_codon:yes stop_codon:yes gene_type:complete
MYYRIINGIAESKQVDINGFPGVWAEESEGFTTGDLYDEDNGWSHPVKTSEELEAEGREWRDGELQSTDNVAQTPDYPNRDALLIYRQELRDWPSTDAFPDTKPIKP